MRLMSAIPGSKAAVLTDAQGDPIDYVHRIDIPELDVMLLGAQLGQGVVRVQTTATRRAMNNPYILIEAELGTMMASCVRGEYTLVLLLDPDAPIGVAWPAFEQAHHHVKLQLA
jgi:hypothetical protein